MTTNICKYY